MTSIELHVAQVQPRRFKVYEKGGCLSAGRRMQDMKNPAKCAGQAVLVVLESIVTVPVTTSE